MVTNVSFVGLEPTDTLKDYALQKINKHEEFLKDALTLTITFRESIHSRGVDKDFRLDINVELPNALVRVEEKGRDMYAIIDEASEILTRRLKRYHDRKLNWEGKTPWKVIEAEEVNNTLTEEDEDHMEAIDNYSNYMPRIRRRTKLEDLTPLSEGEAIEKMELMGARQLLFKNKGNGKMCMVYSADDGGYALVEPADTLEI